MRTARPRRAPLTTSRASPSAWAMLKATDWRGGLKAKTMSPHSLLPLYAWLALSRVLMTTRVPSEGVMSKALPNGSCVTGAKVCGSVELNAVEPAGASHRT